MNACRTLNNRSLMRLAVLAGSAAMLLGSSIAQAAPNNTPPAAAPATTAVAGTKPAEAAAKTKSEHASAAEAKAMVEAAIAYIKQVGPDQAYKDFSAPAPSKWHDRDLYVYAVEMEGKILAHGAFPKMIGKDMSSLRTADDKPLQKSFVDIVTTKGEGWFEYQWPHPETKVSERKKAFVKKVPGQNAFVGAGVYQVD